MKHLNLSCYEPGEMVATLSKDGKVAVWTVTADGGLEPSDNRIFASGVSVEDQIDVLDLTTRTYNVLKREGVHTIAQMMAVYDTGGVEGFDAMRNLGEKSRDEIIGHILRLRGDDPPAAEPTASLTFTQAERSTPEETQ